MRTVWSSSEGGWYNTSVFLRLKVRLKFFAASEKVLTMCCRASSVWARRAQSSANSSSVMSFSMVFVCTRKCRRSKRTDVRKRMQIPYGRSSFASRIMMLKKLENNVGARMHPCVTPLEMGKLPDRDPLCFI